MFNRENKKDIENATNIFRTIAAEMGFRKEPIKRLFWVGKNGMKTLNPLHLV